MAIKRIVPEVDYPITTVEFADGKRTLEQWEQEYATNELALEVTKRLGKARKLSDLTYQEWLDTVYSQYSLKRYLSGRNLNTKRQLAKQPTS